MKTMLKWMSILVLAAATAQAGREWAADAPCDGVPPPPCGAHMMPPPGGKGCHPPCMKGKPGCPGMAGKESCEGEPRHMGPTPEQREEFEAFRKLCKDVRSETDEAKKAELVEELRGKLGRMADEQCERQKARLADAEERIAEQKARLDAQVEALRAMIDDAETHRSEWIEEQLECILSGERPPMRRMYRGEGRPGRCGDGPAKEGCGRKHGPRGGRCAPPPPPPEEEPIVGPGDDGEMPPPQDGEE